MYKENLRLWYLKKKVGKLCLICHEKNPKCLEFHHKNPNTKRMSVSRMVNRGKPKRIVLKEMKKCIILCANCHKKLHFGSDMITLRKKSSIEKYVINIKNKGKCAKCEEKAPCCLEFHHKIPDEKSFSIGEAIRKRVDKYLIMEEIEKCQLLCRNCHRKEH